MSLKVAQAGINLGLGRSVKTKNVLFLGFFGGEPLLEPELLFEALAYARTQAQHRGKKVFFNLTTNGTQVTEALASRLAEEKVQLCVSLDGAPKSHNLMRTLPAGGPSYADAERGYLRLRSAGLTPKINCVVRPETVHTLAQGLKHFAKLGAQTIIYSVDYHCEWTPAARARLSVAALELGRCYQELGRAGQPLHVEPFATKLMLGQEWWRRNQHRCGFGREELAVAPDGTLYPCERLVGIEANPAHSVGTLDSGLDETRVQQLFQESRKLPAYCKACSLRPQCARWCGCTNLVATGDAGSPSDFFCYSEQVFIQTTNDLSQKQ